MKYVLVFNPNARRYSRKAAATILEQAAAILPHATIAVTYTVPRTYNHNIRYAIDDFAHCSRDADCVVAIGGDGTVNLVVSALICSGLSTHVPLGVIPYGTGNNLVRSYGLERQSEKALLTIRQGYTINLDIGLVNQQYYFVNASFGAFSYLIARRVTKSLLGWTYDTMRHLGFTPWPVRLRYTDAAGGVVELPGQRYIVGILLNTSYYGSILHMAPDAVSDDGLFNVKLVGKAPRFAYPLIFTMLLTGQYNLCKNTKTFRARRIEIWPDAACPFETDGDPIPIQPHYTVEMAGQVRLLVPPPPQK